MSEAKFQVGEYVQLVNLGSGNSPQYEGTFAKVLANRPATNPDNGYYYDVVVHDGRTKGLFERRLQKLPFGTGVLVGDVTGYVEDVYTTLYGIRTGAADYHVVKVTAVQPVLTTQTSSTTQEETSMEAQVNTLKVGTKVRAIQDITGNTGRVLWLKGAVGAVRRLDELGDLDSVRCADDWFYVPRDQRQYWEVVSDDTPLTVCKPEPVVDVEPVPETLVGKRVKIRKSSTFYADQGRTNAGKRRKGTVVGLHSGGKWANVKFDDGYRNGYPIIELKIIKDKPKVPKFVPAAVTKDTPVGTKVRVKSKDHHTSATVGAVGYLARHDLDEYPKVCFANDFWYIHYADLETAHPDTAITKDNGDATL